MSAAMQNPTPQNPNDRRETLDQRQNPDPNRQMPTQSPEDTLDRISGVPKTPEQLEAERQAMDQERADQRRVEAPSAPVAPTPATHDERERRADKAS